MFSRRSVDGVPAVIRNRALVACGLAVLSVLFCATGGLAQQGESPKPASTAIPTLEALPHSPTPHGDFEAWCGLNDVVLMRAEMLEAFAGATKLSTVLVPRATYAQCSDDGQRLVVVYDDTGWISEVDVTGGAATRTLATFEKQQSLANISFSPDLRSVASDRPLTLASGVVNLKVIQVNGKNVHHIGWNRTSTEFLVVLDAPERAAPNMVEIFNAQNERIGSGALPPGAVFRDGWFADPRTLYLYLGWSSDEFGAGAIFRCRFDGWKCQKIASNVLEASMGGDGILGIVGAVGKYSSDGDTTTYPSAYVVEMRGGRGQVVARQKFSSRDGTDFGLTVAPSGGKALLTWFGKRGPACPAETQKTRPCKAGMLIDLSGVRK